MVGETIYGLSLAGLPSGDFVQKAGVGAGSFGMFPMSLGQNYTDSFQRARAPTQLQLLGGLVGTAYRCVNLNANLLATSRLRLYVKKKSGEPRAKFLRGAEHLGRRISNPIDPFVWRGLRHAKYVSPTLKSALVDAVEDNNDIEEVKEHPILDLLREPEDALSDGGLIAYDHRWTTQALLEDLGRSYWYVRERNSFGQPKRVTVLRSQMVREVVDQTGERYIDHYEYGTSRLAVRDVIRFTVPDPSNPHLGFLSPMRAAWEKVSLMRGGDAFLSALLENGGYPAGMWSPKGDSEGGGIGSAEARRMQTSFRSSFAMGKAGGIFISEYPGSLQTLAFKPAELIDVERARELSGSIADCFDVPRTKIFRDTSNRAAGESGDMDHAKDAGLSRCSRFEETLNGQLVPLFDDSKRLFLAFDSPLPAERTLILDETRLGGSLGLTTINEGREALGLVPTDEEIGSVRIIPDKSLLVKPDGTLLGDVGKLDQAKAEAALHPPAVPVAPGANPAAGKPKKNDTKKLLRQLTKAVTMLAQQKEANEVAQSRTNPAERIPEAVERSDRCSERANAKGGGDVASRLRKAGYSEEEIEAKMNPRRNGHHVCSL